MIALTTSGSFVIPEKESFVEHFALWDSVLCCILHIFGKMLNVTFSAHKEIYNNAHYTYCIV